MSEENKQKAPLFSMTQEETKAEKLIDPKEKRLANWIEDIVTMQRVNLVLLILTLMMLILHMSLDFFFHV